jgi:hypothetical protein
MIIPKRDAKCYGAVHIDNYLTFTGFCKKVGSDELCEVDVVIDGKKIDTLKADKRIAKVEEIYDIEGHGFAFELEEKYFEKSHTLEFKASSGEELVNSKIQTINKNHPKFNEYRFLHSLSHIDVEKVKDLYCKDAIGFLATEENMNDKDFVEYIKELYNRFPQVTFKTFYFSDNQKNLVEGIFLDQLDRLELFLPNNMYDIASSIEIFIEKWIDKGNSKLFWSLFKNCRNIYTTGFLSAMFNQKINNNDCKLDIDVIKKIDSTYNIENVKSRGEFNFYDLLSFALQYEEFKYMKYEFNQKYLLEKKS